MLHTLRFSMVNINTLVVTAPNIPTFQAHNIAQKYHCLNETYGHTRKPFITSERAKIRPH